jgi:DNA (cytosine-5)-methyltransferase 1
MVMDMLFDLPQVSLGKKIRLVTLFSGIGSQEMALRDIGVDFEIHGMVEFDKFAVKSYNAVHGTSFDVSDVRDVHASDLAIVDTDEYDYVMFYSFPCTSLSVAGKMEGMREDSGTASSLLWEVKRIISEMSEDELPKVLIMENVPQVHANKNISEFNRWLDFLKERGYYSYWQDLNARDFGIPQNRNRCICVSIRYDSFIDFEFPKAIPLKYRMKDFLERNVDEKYFINSVKAMELIDRLLDDGFLDKTRKKKERFC